MGLRALGRVAWQAGKGWADHRAPRMAAALAYYGLVSLAPLLLISFRLAGALLDEADVYRQFVQAAEALLGRDNAEFVAAALTEAHRQDGEHMLTLGLALLAAAATAVAVELQDAMNTIWGVCPRPGWEWWMFLRRRLVSFLLILVPAALALTLILLAEMAEMAIHTMGGLLPGQVRAWARLPYLAGLPLLWLCLAFTYRLLPDVRMPWPPALAGAAVAVVLLTLGREGLNLYLSRSRVVAAFGAARSVLLFLVWSYYAAMMFLYGAEFARAQAMRRPETLQPQRHAMWTARPGG